MQSYPPLGRQQAMHPRKSIGRAGRMPRLTAQPPMEQIDPAIKDIRIVSGRDLTSLFYTPISGVWWDVRKMRPTGQNKRSPRGPGRSNGVTDVMTDGVAGTGNPSKEGNISGMPPLGEVGSVHSGRVSLTVAAEAAEDVN